MRHPETERSLLLIIKNKKIIYFNFIVSVEFIPGYFDITFYLFDIFFNTSSYRWNTHPARITFDLHSDQTYSIVEFGNKKGFEEMVKRVEKAV